MGDDRVELKERGVCYLMADLARRDSSLVENRLTDSVGVKRLWVEGWKEAAQFLSWSLKSPVSGCFQVILLARLPIGAEVEVASSGGTVRAVVPPDQPRTGEKVGPYILPPGWTRLVCGLIPVAQGEDTLTVRLVHDLDEAHEIKSVELVHEADIAPLAARVEASRRDTTWMGDAGYGVMLQWGQWGYPPTGAGRKSWPRQILDFDVGRFCDLMEECGAGWVVWSVSWATYYIPAPIRAAEEILPGRTCSRDLLGELADELGRRGIRLLFYYHLGHDTARGDEWWSRNWVGGNDDKALMIANWKRIIGEMGERYGERLSGWLFDDGCAYYPCGFEELIPVARRGNEQRLIAWNPSHLPPVTEFEDVQFGEHFTGEFSDAVDAEGIWRSGVHAGRRAHGNFKVDGPGWGICEPDQPIAPPRHSVEEIAAAVRRRQALSCNILMYEDQSIAPTTLAWFEALKRLVRGA